MFSADDLAEVMTVLDQADHVGIVVIDGPSGAGKSSLADTLLALRPQTQLVRLDDIYHGWNGLEYASEHVVRELLVPRSNGEPARWQRYDWRREEAAEWNSVDGDRPLVIEGCGVLTRASAPLADLRIWLDADLELRKRRALARDANGYEPFWDLWQAQFDAFVMREQPRELADVILTVVE